MDPITAITNLLTAITKLITVIAEGQTAEQRKIFWDWWIEDMKPVREFLKKLISLQQP